MLEYIDNNVHNTQHILRTHTHAHWLPSTVMLGGKLNLVYCNYVRISCGCVNFLRPEKHVRISSEKENEKKIKLNDKREETISQRRHNKNTKLHCCILWL